MEGKSLPEHLFLDVMIEKTQILIEFIRNHHLGLCLTANITKNTAVVQIYDNFAMGNTLLLQVTVSNLPNFETQLFQLYTEIHRIVHQYMPKDDDFMLHLEDITDDESQTSCSIFYCLYVKDHNYGTQDAYIYMISKSELIVYIQIVNQFIKCN